MYSDLHQDAGQRTESGIKDRYEEGPNNIKRALDCAGRRGKNTFLSGLYLKIYTEFIFIVAATNR
jgi:hypothetical protein